MTVLRNATFRLTSLICFIFGFVFVATVQDAKNYLEKFGYLETQDGPISNLIFRGNAFENALRKFQLHFSLKNTGRLDTDTMKEMNKPRCGVVDSTPRGYERRGNYRPQRFSFFGQRWSSKYISYRITKYSKQTSARVIDRDVSRAMKAWASISPLTFQNKRFGRADIALSFQEGEHGDGQPFDGRQGVLAHAFAPKNGQVHFDEGDKFDFGDLVLGGIHFFYVVVHEVGHALGLGHSEVRGAIMFPSYPTTARRQLFHDDDKTAINILYQDSKSPIDDLSDQVIKIN